MPAPEKTAARLLARTSRRPALGLILGSAFGGLENAIQNPLVVPYRLLPGFLPPSVQGHAGKAVIGELQGATIVALCGRSHFYEGRSLAAVTFPVRVLAACGIEILVLTNAAGGINPRFRPGDFMSLTDHLNLMGGNPLRGSSRGQQVRFVDLSQTYDPELNERMRQAARRARVRLRQGVYAAVCGPGYETPAEIRALALLGADAVGMSTVPEAIVARQCALRVTALSLITNPAAGLTAKPISHADVLKAGSAAVQQATTLLQEFVRGLTRH